MEKLTFAPLIDIPLIAITLAVFVGHFNRWALRNDVDSSLNLASRLPRARVRVVTLFVCILLVCWYGNLAVWSIVALLLGVGFVLVLLFGVALDGSVFGLLFAAYLIREWAFGFPQLILQPPTDQQSVRTGETPRDDLIGQIGITLSPIRPTGEVEIEGVRYSVASDDGQLLDAGVIVKVTSRRNGRPCVTAIDPQEGG
jgi:membrane-bound serine protease (ClpP class)